jgi:nucleoside-diphosphate-sugar epimerase
LLEWAAFNGSSLVLLRVPGIYGPGRLYLERIEQGTPILREEDANPGNRIHVDDLARCCLAALQEDVPAGIYNVGDGDKRSTTWFIREIARQAGLPAPPVISLAQAKQEFSATRLSFLVESRRVDTTKMREVLGVIPTYSNPEQGISASLTDD